MKGFIIAILVLLETGAFCFGQSFVELLDKAKTQYTQGDKNGAILTLDSARKIANSEVVAASTDYIEIKNWDVVKVKFAQYEGKKVKVYTSSLGFSSNGERFMIGLVDGSCTYNDNLVDTLLSLEGKHWFFGTVIKEGYLSSMHIERVE